MLFLGDPLLVGFYHQVADPRYRNMLLSLDNFDGFPPLVDADDPRNNRFQILVVLDYALCQQLSVSRSAP